MKTNVNRKVVLLVVLAVLVCVYCLQVVFTGKNRVRVVSVKDEPDSFVIQSGAGSEVKLFKDGDSWFVGEKKYPANSYSAGEMCEAVTSVKILGTAMRALNVESMSGEAERYGLDADSRITVKAYKDGKEIQTVFVGKDTSTGRQSYIQFKNDNTVYLAGDALHSTFGVSVNDLRGKEVYSLDNSEISSVFISYNENGEQKSFSFGKSADVSEEEGVVSKEEWNWFSAPKNKSSYSSEIIELPSNLDTDKVTNWVRSLSTLNASEWLDDEFSIQPQDCDFFIDIFMKDKTTVISLRGYEKDDETYLYCSEVPYCFKVASYIGARFTKRPADFVKDSDAE